MKRVFEWSQSGDEVAEAFWALTSYEQGLVFVRLAELQEAVVAKVREVLTESLTFSRDRDWRDGILKAFKLLEPK